MPEPTRDVRPIRMKRAGAGLLLAPRARRLRLVVEQGEERRRPHRPSPAPRRSGRAPATARGEERAHHRERRPRRRRHRDPVRLTGGGGECADTLFARPERLPLLRPRDGPPVTSAFAVALPGPDGQLLVTRADHPRGGFQLRVYAAGRRELAELEVDGTRWCRSSRPTCRSTREHRLRRRGARGHRGGRARAAGRRAAWDVKRTTYAVDGTTVRKGPPRRSPTTCCPSSSTRSTPSWSGTRRSRAAALSAQATRVCGVCGSVCDGSRSTTSPSASSILAISSAGSDTRQP